MGISEEIKQTDFKSVHQKAMINLLFTSNWLHEQTRIFLNQDELTPQQFNVLRILRGSRGRPISTQTIRDRMIDKMSDTSRIVDRLILKKLVKKSVCKKDKRLVDVVITDAGLQLLARIDSREEQLINLLKNLSEQEAATLNDLLDKLRTCPDEEEGACQ